MREKLNVPRGERYELCRSVHAEQNAIVQAAKLGLNTEGATCYVTHQPCATCSRLLISAGIRRIVYLNPYPDEFSLELLAEAGVKLEKFEDIIKE